MFHQKYHVWRQAGFIAPLLILAVLGILIYLLISSTFPFKDKLFSSLYPKKPSIAANHGIPGDLWSDVIIGKPDFSEIAPYSVVPNKLFLPHGVIVDRSKSPNKLYVYDAGNNRILGFDLGKCLASSTNPLNCSADLVLGQPSMITSACNGDSGFQNYPTRAPASAATLCGEKEATSSISEGGSGSSMAINAQGDLFVNDGENNRVLRYIRPFETDNVADEVWGQSDFTGNQCNRGQSSPDATTFCFNWGRSNNWTAGVDIDSSGNTWVVDNGNNRVLRFPAGSKTADLVLGQSNFTSAGFGSGLNQFDSPAAVRVSSSGKVYVVDQGNNRVLTFVAPLVSDMSGNVFGSGFSAPSGVDFDPTEPGKVWIADMGHNLVKLLDESSGAVVKQIGRQGDGNVLGDATGSIGIDSSGNIFIAEGKGDNDNDVVMYAKGGATDLPAKRVFGATFGNQPSAAGLAFGAGVVVSDNQLIVADRGRLLFWNNPQALTNGKPADGVTGAGGINNFTTVRDLFYNIKADKNHHLWVIGIQEGDYPDRIEVYNLPLTTGASPIKTLTLPFNVLGGGQVFSTGQYQSFSGLAPADDGSFIWLSHRATNRVLRVRNPLTNPVVDVILGQTDINGTQCNRGAAPQSGATSTSLCSPGSLSLDRFGNLFVSDHFLEIDGNMRLLVFKKELFPLNNTSVIYAPAASKIFPNIAVWEMAFDSQNKMVVGFNPYWAANPQGGWFPAIYNDPLSSSTAPDSFLKDYHSMAFAATFDGNDNLYIGDLNRGRILVYKSSFSSPTPTPILTSTPTPTPLPTPTSAPTPTPTPADTEPPTAPANLTGSPVSSSQINLSWTASSDNVKVTGYDIYRNHTKAVTVTTTSYGDTGLAASTTYSYYVKAFDAAGNVSSSSNTISVTTQASSTTTGKISTTVYSSGSVLSGVVVSIKINKSKKNYVTDSQGVVNIINVPPGIYTLTFKKSGYLTQTSNVTVTSGATSNLVITLSKR